MKPQIGLETTYSTAGVQEYWIVNVAEACVEQYRFDGTAAEVIPQVWNVEHKLTFEVGGKVIRLDLKVLFERGLAAHLRRAKGDAVLC